ncbi:MAG TPA: archaemetzincin family Zn-dependent metalloprotease [Candidatus Bilamarchaeum sp.]|nr:archaemetzincin family Zn-dependent metalloprotease [Candidatus Bilamarchaeum sp.]
MKISIVLLGRTVPGFGAFADRISKEFKDQVRTELIDFPLTRSYRGDRKQYHADILLRELARIAGSEDAITLFITREDIFSGNLNFVFGLAGRRSCIVSMARLDPRFYGPLKDPEKARALFKERLLKEAIHEIGHTLGLPHCEDKKCVMVYSNSVADVDFKGTAFCGSCKKVIKTYLG